MCFFGALEYFNNRLGGAVLPIRCRVLAVRLSKWFKNKLIKGNRTDIL